MDINLVIGQDNVAFQMTFDPNFWSDIGMREYLLRNGLCEPEVVHAMKRILRPGDIAFDGGANVGFFTVLMSKLVGEKGSVVAFEPGINNIQKFNDNIALNHLKNVKLIQQPLWKASGEELEFNLSHDSGLNSLGDFPEVLSRMKMTSTTVSDWYSRATCPRFMKIDIEGAEEFAVAGMGSPRIPFVICEVYPMRMVALGSSTELLRLAARKQGYDMFLLAQDGALPTLVPVETEVVKPEMPALNVLFSTIEDVGSVWKRVEIKNG